MTTPSLFNTTDPLLAGEALRDTGMMLASRRKRHRIVTDQLALLDAIIGSADGTATADDAATDDHRIAGYDDGGKWRGTVTRELSDDGIIRCVAATRSKRPTRHAGWIGRWAIADRALADARRAYLRKWLRDHPLPIEPELFDFTNEKPGAPTPGI